MRATLQFLPPPTIGSALMGLEEIDTCAAAVRESVPPSLEGFYPGYAGGALIIRGEHPKTGRPLVAFARWDDRSLLACWRGLRSRLRALCKEARCCPRRSWI